ncbi:endonuclease/exonuclease/phosphatase family protein [Parabacteroides gordonii]|uniref:Endonuclease/exonuclease/phosphatase domain-containing protein n=1 Tax=Parabacteroides gordonii MS-1 = DSM 23371 TaxID=1203610 RepID=A0A0F5JM91_9BACT|nr:endonuclease/exonuclease/phosphatase family protein [Parabacteroides gordonii]KKB58537.1 hypothetical protein HMPREF1536_01414 [Parabacteroides gordonii MS-1 = DSM 23371]MCA5583202.1 endonuclease/exonuclease/phosphatase family protein [Parabacteroides gordonii]
MKRLFNSRSVLFLFLLLVCSGIYAQTSNSYERDWRTDRQKIKIISYNIMDGFSNGADKDRIARFTAWVKEQSPDVLALNELCGFTEAKLKELAAGYGHPYAAIVKENGYPVGLTSKTPIQVIDRKIDGYGHGLLHCKVLNMDFLVTHLNPSDRLKRKQEADNIVNYITDNRLTDCLLMGDMNAHSPFDASWTDEHLENYAVISTFMAASLHDICYLFTADAQRYSFPTRILVSSPKGDALRRQQERIDFIFVTDSLRPNCVDAQIYNGSDTDYLSDHYPVGISMFIPKE